MKKKKDYISRGSQYFIEFLPPKVYESLWGTESEKFYKQYRFYHRHIFMSEQKIKGYKKEIEKLNKKIKEEKLKINGTENKDGWKLKMLEGYTRIGHLSKVSKDYEFYCSISLKDKRKSITYLKQEKGLELNRNLHNTSDIWSDKTKDGRDRNNPSVDFSTFRDKIGKGQIKEEIKGKVYERCIITVESKDKQFRRKIYVGGKENYLQVLRVYNSNIQWDSKTDNYIKENLRDIYKGFVRYQIYKRGMEGFYNYSGKSKNDSPYDYESVISWIEKTGDKIGDWMDK
jgi:hypothetical protein